MERELAARRRRVVLARLARNRYRQRNTLSSSDLDEMGGHSA
jgi:hypothetical protein